MPTFERLVDDESEGDDVGGEVQTIDERRRRVGEASSQHIIRTALK